MGGFCFGGTGAGGLACRGFGVARVGAMGVVSASISTGISIGGRFARLS
jgi:hypothetical protein